MIVTLAQIERLAQKAYPRKPNTQAHYVRGYLAASGDVIAQSELVGSRAEHHGAAQWRAIADQPHQLKGITMTRPNLGPAAERERTAQIIRATRTSGKRPAKPQDNDPASLPMFAALASPSLL